MGFSNCLKMGSFQNINNISECLQQQCDPMLHSNLCKGLNTFSQEHKTHITHWLSDWLTYDFSSTWRYSKDVRCLVCAAFHWHFELKEKKIKQINNSGTAHGCLRADTHVWKYYHMLYEDEGRRRLLSEESGVLRASYERSLVTSIWTST